MTMTHEEVEERAEQVLRKTDTYREPVPIELLAHRLKLTTEAASLGQDVSGMLVAKDERGAIAYNSAHSHVRQRLTVAHEIAHFVLHLKKNRRSQLFIDRYIVFRGDGIADACSDHEEVQANLFGAALLMPASLVRQEIIKRDLDLDDEEAFSFLAKRFQVGTAAMTKRLINLGVLR
jgi:Zn-dependent peptidase ImmA (M78 family)